MWPAFSTTGKCVLLLSGLSHQALNQFLISVSAAAAMAEIWRLWWSVSKAGPCHTWLCLLQTTLKQAQSSHFATVLPILDRRTSTMCAVLVAQMHALGTCPQDWRDGPVHNKITLQVQKHDSSISQALAMASETEQNMGNN